MHISNLIPVLLAAAFMAEISAGQTAEQPAPDGVDRVNPYDLLQQELRDAAPSIEDGEKAARTAAAEAERQIPEMSAERDTISSEVETTAKKLGVPVPKTPPVLRRVMDPGIVENVDGSRLIDEFLGNSGWFLEDWGDKGKLTFDGERIMVNFTVGTFRKVALTKFMHGKLKLDANDVLTIEADPKGSANTSIAIAFFVGHVYHESPSQRLRPGQNAVKFPLSARNFKSQATGWQYRGALSAETVPDKLTVLFYSGRPGTVAIDRIRVSKAR